MRLAVFSDLHLAADATNQCTASAAELLALFDEIDERADRVLVNGDLFNLDRPPAPGAWRRQLEALRNEMVEVVERLKRYEWIYGNHDEVLVRKGVPEERVYMADELRILALHGHQFDMWLKKLPGLAPTANFVAGWLERARFKAVSRAMGRVPLALDRFARRLMPSSGASGAGGDRSLAAARAMIEEDGWDAVVFGHSHFLRLVACAGGLFINTGSLTLDHIDWVLIDTEQARVDAFRDGARVQTARKEGDRWSVEGSAPDERSPLA